MNFLFSRIQNKLIAAFILVVVIPLLVVGIYSYQTTSNLLLQNEVDKKWQVGKSQSLQVVQFLAKVMNDVLFWSHDKHLNELVAARRGGNSEAIKKALTTILEDFSGDMQKEGFYHKLRYIDENGQEVFTILNDRHLIRSLAKNELQDKSDRYYFKETMKLDVSKVFVSYTDLEEEHGEIVVPHIPVVRYATPIFYADGRRAGIIIATVEAAYVLSSVHLLPGEVGGHYLVDQDGYFLHHTDASKQWGRSLKKNITLKSEFPRIAEAVEQTGKAGAIILENELVAFSKFALPGHSEMIWTIVSVHPMEQIMGPVNEFTLVFMILTAVALLGAIILAIVMARGISSPVLHLAQVADQISRGDFETEIKAKSNDEIGQLAESVRRMRSSLEAAISRLRKRKR